MMHQKLNFLLNLRNKSRFRRNSRNLRYISYSIPLACIMVLIFGLIYGVIFVNDNQSEEVFAADIPSSTASISIASPTLSNSSNPTNPNSMAYLSTNVTINAAYIQSYSLKISGSPNLTGASTISGTGTNVAVSSMGNNTWGYNWGATGTTDSNLTYSSLSTSGATLALDGLNSTGNANFTKKLTFAVKFGSAETGHYTNDVTLSFTANPKTLIGYSVTYDVNGGIGGPSNYSEFSYDASKTYTIPSTPLPTRDGYNFLGWSTSSTATTADVNYAPGKSITLTQASPTRKLYAIWVKPFGGITTMQQMTTAICAAESVGSTITLSDTRGPSGNSSYIIVKAADDNCWMMGNLRLPSNTVIYSSNSNITASSYTLPANTEKFSSYDNYTVQQMLDSSNNDYGAYYSWCTATAGTCHSTAEVSAPSDICPKGWRMPKGGASGEIKALYDLYHGIFNAGIWLGGADTAAGGVFFSPAGRMLSGYSVLQNAGGGGYYWTSTSGGYKTIYQASIAYSVWIYNNSSAGGSSTDVWSDGFSVRCVAK